ncbi:hypothetical protein [Maribacter luteus]|uniref:Uncharacterized protein n=1 Tax=Maribacter luteus TaxID=2594478 RepID=A0A6I2MLC2_9FLAO|nr:hypothetical protein [Maribacter luteus]MRX62934.1 hypothetical protein [Maribacter luteus]
MVSFWWSPRWAFLSGAFMLLLLLITQLQREFLSDFQVSNGKLAKHEIQVYRGMEDERVLYLWLNDTLSKPYFSKFKQPQRKINRNISFIKKYGVTIWHNDKREIKQLKSNKTIIVDYDWFWWPSLLFYLAPSWLHFGIFLIVKKESININSYTDMWNYTMGNHDIILISSRKKYRSGGLLPFLLFSPMFRSTKNRKSIFDSLIISWRQFFNICNVHAMNPEVRRWMNQQTKGKEFIDGFDFYRNLIKTELPSYKLVETTESIFKFISLRIDSGREHYEDFGKLFRQEFPNEYYKMLEQLNKLR